MYANRMKNKSHRKAKDMKGNYEPRYNERLGYKKEKEWENIYDKILVKATILQRYKRPSL